MSKLKPDIKNTEQYKVWEAYRQAMGFLPSWFRIKYGKGHYVKEND